jgi:hypothetical protein
MSRMYDAMRNLAHKSAPETGSEAALSNLVGALIEELANEVPDDPYLESVRADLLAASCSYETCEKKDLALRFYLAFRSLLREHVLLQERLRKAEASKMNRAPELENVEKAPSIAR